MKLYKKWLIPGIREIIESNFNNEKKELYIFDDQNKSLLYNHLKQGKLLKTNHSYFCTDITKIPEYKDCKIRPYQ